MQDCVKSIMLINTILINIYYNYFMYHYYYFIIIIIRDYFSRFFN